MTGTRPSTVRSSVRRRLWVLVASFLAILAAEAWVSLEALEDLSALSGYRRGLEDWTRARSAAAGHLHQFLETGDPAEWRGFRARLQVLEGFEGTRVTLAGPLVRELEALGREIDSRLLAGPPDGAEAGSFHRRIGELDRELEAAELAFSDTLQESREALEDRFRTEQLAAVALLLVLVLAVGLWTSLRLDREVEQRQEAERALTASQERLQETLDHSTILFYSHDRDQRITYVSPQSREFLGCEPEEALTRWMEFVTDHPANREGLERTERALRTGRRQPPYELQLRRADGSLLWVEVHEAPVVRDGETVGLVGSLSDVTERKRAEEERLRLEERLREVERLEAVGRLAGGVAHDFNNLLTAILGHCDLALRMVGPETPVFTQVEEVKRAARRAADLTRQLLAFSRRQVVEPRVLDLNRAVDDATNRLRRLIGEDVRVEVHLSANPATVLMDPSQVDQVLVNLAVNARDAMPGGGRLAIGTDLERRNGDGGDGPVDLPPGEYVVLTVSDTGEGMDPVTRQHAFEPFFTTKPKGKGTGLGLATVYGIVKQNSGFIDVESEPGAGTTFRVSLPKVAGTAQEERTECAQPGPSRGSAMVLLVEDDPAVRGLVRHVLSEHGYSVLEAPESNAALALFEEHHGEIDLLITDLVLPGLSGDGLAARIAEARPDLPTLFISGYSETFLGERGVVREDVRLLQKPFEAGELLARVEALLRAPAAHAAR